MTLHENPLDLYFLMDFSKSMDKDIVNLINVTKELGQTVKDLTSDYRVGFGSYVEKCVPPFAKHPDYYTNKTFMPYSFRQVFYEYSNRVQQCSIDE